VIAAGLIRAAPVQAGRPWGRRLMAPEDWRTMAGALPASHDVALLAMWADQAQVHAIFHDLAVPEILPVSVDVVDGGYPALSPVRPAAVWFERMIADLWGHVAQEGVDPRPWLDHGWWEHHTPMAARPVPVAGPAQPPAFLPVEGEDLTIVPVGPIHAGIIEAGHFRLTCAGETVVRLEAGLQASRHPIAAAGQVAAGGGAVCRAAVGGFDGGAFGGIRAGGGSGLRRRGAAAGAGLARRDGGARADRQSLQRHRRDLQ
jgi:Ni,Fe-hydrogenase III component G